MTGDWEYALIEHMMRLSNEAVYVYFYKDGQPVQRKGYREGTTGGPLVLGALHQMGQEGWELVTSSSASTGRTQLWLKRSICQGDSSG